MSEEKEDHNEWWYIVGGVIALAAVVRFAEIILWTTVLVPIGWLAGRGLARNAWWWSWPTWISALGSAALTAAAVMIAIPQSVAQMWHAGPGFTVEHPILVAQGLSLQLPAFALAATVRAVIDRWKLTRDALPAHRKQNVETAIQEGDELRAQRRRDRERKREIKVQRRELQNGKALPGGALPFATIAEGNLRRNQMWGWRKGLLYLPTRTKHLLIAGESGSGKTETLLRAAEIHLARGNRVFVIDGKGDRETQERFVRLAAKYGIQARIWPQEPWDIWRGRPEALHQKLVGMLPRSENPYYEAIGQTLMRAAVESPKGPPQNCQQLIDRINDPTKYAPDHLRRNIAKLAKERPEDLMGEQMRIVELLAKLSSIGSIDGGWSWEDTKAAYVRLPGRDGGEAATAVGQAMLVDLEQWSDLGSVRRPEDDCDAVVMVDEFARISKGGGEAAIGLLERARSARVSFYLSVQGIEGLADDARNQRRMMKAGANIILHTQRDPDDWTSYIGTVWRAEAGQSFDGDVATVRAQHQAAINPNTLRGLGPGEIVILADRGEWARAQVIMADIPAEVPATISARVEPIVGLWEAHQNHYKRTEQAGTDTSPRNASEARGLSQTRENDSPSGKDLEQPQTPQNGAQGPQTVSFEPPTQGHIGQPGLFDEFGPPDDTPGQAEGPSEEEIDEILAELDDFEDLDLDDLMGGGDDDPDTPPGL